MTDEAQCHINNETTRHISSLFNLRSQRNTLSPISRLPPEILAEIFIQGARDHHEDRFPGIDVPGWVNVSYVCRQWRKIALDCPTLWSYLFSGSQQWTKALLARSKQAPLKITIEIGPSEELYQSTKKVADHAERIQELRLHVENDYGDPLQMPCLRVPRLQVLKILAHRPYVVENALFNGEAPSLRKLDLANVTMSNWHSFRLSDLKSLSVQNFY